MAVKARFGSSKGGAGVLERPKFDQTQFDPSTQLQEGTFFFSPNLSVGDCCYQN